MREALPLLLALGCAPSPAKNLVVDVTPPRTDASSAQAATPKRDEAFERCKARIEKSSPETKRADAPEIANACSELYAEPACRDAWVRGFAPETDPSERVAIVIEGCRHGYCDDFPEAMLCKDAWTTWAMEERAAAWSSFREQILTREIGADRMRELEELSLRARGAQSSGETSAGTAGATAGAVTLVVDGAGTTTFDGVKVDASALVEELRRRLTNDPSATLEVVVEPNTPIEVTRKIMDDARAAGFTRVAISAKK